MTTISAETTILLLEDVKTFRKLMIKDLRKMGIIGKIYEATDLSEAFSLCASKSFDFIISDWKLPDGTGYDFLINVKNNEKLSNLPFVMFTTIDDVEHMLKAIEAGANEFIVKPWLYDDLVKKLNYSWQKQIG